MEESEKMRWSEDDLDAIDFSFDKFVVSEEEEEEG